MKKAFVIISVLILCMGAHAATLAYWNFEDGTPNAPMNPKAGDGVAQIGTRDISGNNRHMWAYNDFYGPLFSSLHDTPTGIGLSSRHDGHRDGYCFDSVLQAWSPSVWTIEFSFRLGDLTGWRTMIGRDGWAVYNGTNIDVGAALYIQKNGENNAIRLNFATASGERISLDSTLFPALNQWYHFAIVANGDTINMFADRLDGNEFQSVGSFNLTPGRSHALLATGTWSFGRGWWNNNLTDQIVGNLDDIRLSDVALTPDQFIHSRYAYNPTPAVNAPNVPASQKTLSWTNRDNVKVCQVYFGKNVAEPNSVDYKKVLTLIGRIDNPAKTSSIEIPANMAPAAGDVCYWVVDSYRNSAPPAEPNLPGLLWTFKVNNNRVPVVNAGVDQGAWLGMNGTSGEATVTLDGTVTDDGLPNPPAALTLLWTQVSGPAVTISPDNAAKTTVKLTEIGTYEFKLSATDSEFSAEDTVVIFVGANPCLASHMIPNAPGYSAFDSNRDCTVNLLDFADLAAAWLNCTDTLANCK
jgi:hypothetical protein